MRKLLPKFAPVQSAFLVKKMKATILLFMILVQDIIIKHILVSIVFLG